MTTYAPPFLPGGSIVSPIDNLLIFYAGHSEIKQGVCYWLPTDTEIANQKSWLATTSIADILSVMRAHNILILADACFDNIVSSDFANHVGKTSPEYWQKVSEQRSRVAISTVGYSPVMYSVVTNHSHFAEAIFAVLKNAKQEILDKDQFSHQILQFLQSNKKNGRHR